MCVCVCVGGVVGLEGGWLSIRSARLCVMFVSVCMSITVCARVFAHAYACVCIGQRKFLIATLPFKTKKGEEMV